MRISHKYKFVYISIEKTGSTSIRNALDNLCIDSKLAETINYEKEHTHEYVVSNSDDTHLLFHHSSLKNVHRWFEVQGWDWKEYRKFTFIRHPVDRVLSHYFFHKQDRGSPHIKNRESLPEGYKLLVDTSKKYDFNDWVEWIYNRTNKDRFLQCGDYLTSPGNIPIQSHYLYDMDNKPIDYTGKSEQSQLDFDYICENIGIPKLELPRANSTGPRKKYTEYCNASTLNLINKIYKADYDLYRDG